MMCYTHTMRQGEKKDDMFIAYIQRGEVYMKLCYLANAESIHTQRWVSYFADKGHEVHLISLNSFGDYNIENVDLHLIKRLRPQIRVISFPINLLADTIQVRKLIKKIKPNIVHAHFVANYGVLGALSGFYPFVVSAWGSDVLVAPKNSRIIKNLVEYTLKRADLVICDSETVKAGLLELCAKPKNIKKIFDGIDTQRFNPSWNDKELKTTLGISKKAPVVISIRNLYPLYNVEMLIRATPLALNRVPEAKFIIGGDGVQRDYLEKLANSLGITSSIRFVGWIPHDELPKYLASLDVYVSTSLSDSTSISLQEAMACELAPVVTDLPANREWVTDGENGFIVPVNDVQMLAERIICLIENKEVREKFGKTGREIIKEKAEHERGMDRMERIYQGVLKE